MRLGELVAARPLRLRFLVEPRGAGDRVVRRAVVTDLLSPGRYLTGGELVITGLVWRRRPEHSERFVAALASGGAIGLAAGDALLGSVPEDLVAACRRHGLPLLEVPVEVAFADVSEYVAERVEARGGRRPRAVARARELLSAVASGRSLDELLDRVSHDIGRPCRVLSATGRHVVAGPGELDADRVDRLTRGFLEADRLPVTVPTPTAGPGQAYTLVAVGPGLADRLTAWFLAVEHQDDAQDGHDGETAEVLTEVAAIAALDRSRREEGLRAVRHIAEEAVAMVASAAPLRDVAVRLRQVALDPGAPLVAVVVGATGRTGLERVTRTIVEDVVAEFGQPVTADDAGDGGDVVALLGSCDGLAASLRRAFARLAPGLTRSRLCVGVSSPASLQALSGALDEARYARRLAEARRTPVAVVTADEVTSHVILLATVPDEVRRTFAARVLSPVLAYDERTNAGLVTTLETFLACSGSWSRTAEALHVHVNTVRYRIERVEELTGRNLAELADRVDVFLALRSLQPPG